MGIELLLSQALPAIEVPIWQRPVVEQPKVRPPVRQRPIPTSNADPLLGCPDPPVPSVELNAVNLSHSAFLTLKTCSRSDIFYAGDSQVNLFCVAGRCGVFFNTGKYGYDPTRCSQARIGSRVWGWCGSQPDSIAFEMWPFLADGVEVASRIAQWPDRTSNYREKPVYVKRSKIATYNASLGL